MVDISDDNKPYYYIYEPENTKPWIAGSNNYEDFKRELKADEQNKLDFFKRKIMHELLKLNT